MLYELLDNKELNFYFYLIPPSLCPPGNDDFILNKVVFGRDFSPPRPKRQS